MLLHLQSFPEKPVEPVTLLSRQLGLPSLQHTGGAAVCDALRGHDHLSHWFQLTSGIQRGTYIGLMLILDHRLERR